MRERGNLDCGLTLACVRGGPRPAPPTTTRPWWRPGTSWSRQSSAGPLTEILMPGCYQSSIRDESDKNMHNVISNNGCVVYIYIIHRKTGDLYTGGDKRVLKLVNSFVPKSRTVCLLSPSMWNG